MFFCAGHRINHQVSLLTREATQGEHKRFGSMREVFHPMHRTKTCTTRGHPLPLMPVKKRKRDSIQPWIRSGWDGCDCRNPNLAGSKVIIRVAARKSMYVVWDLVSHVTIKVLWNQSTRGLCFVLTCQFSTPTEWSKWDPMRDFIENR